MHEWPAAGLARPRKEARKDVPNDFARAGHLERGEDDAAGVGGVAGFGEDIPVAKRAEGFGEAVFYAGVFHARAARGDRA